MEYQIKKLAELAGVTTRTLRYYDEIGLLKPTRINTSGYRIYGTKEVDRLQQILFFRSMDMKLDEIQGIMSASDYDINLTLEKHHRHLIEKRNQLEQLILNVERTIAYQKGEMSMTDQEKFLGFKKEKLEENEEKYGEEIREKYGEETVEKSNQKFLNLSASDYEKMQNTELKLFETLSSVVDSGDLNSDAAKEVYALHREWLGFTWPSYNPDAHKGLAEMYVHDERFAAYYNDRVGKEVVEMLREIILKYAKA